MTRWLDGRREWDTHVGLYARTLYQMESDIGKIVVEEVHWNWYRGNAMSVSSTFRDMSSRTNTIPRPHLVISLFMGFPITTQSCCIVLLRKHRIYAGIFR
jgi:hypothetical protein